MESFEFYFRGHTAAYVPSSGRVYSFGKGGNGQLGVGSTTNHPSPCTVKGPFIGLGKANAPPVDFSLEKEAPYVVKQIYSGGDQSYVLVTGPQVSAFRSLSILAKQQEYLCVPLTELVN